MRTRTQAMLDWFHGRTSEPMPTPETDVGEAFAAGWNALATEPFIRWCIGQQQRGRIIVALISPIEAQDGPRYAGYYCEDAPRSGPAAD